MRETHGLPPSLADAELASLGMRLRRVADRLLGALDPALRYRVAGDLADLQGDIGGFLDRFGDRLDDRSRTSLILAQQELGAIINALERGSGIAGHA